LSVAVGEEEPTGESEIFNAVNLLRLVLERSVIKELARHHHYTITKTVIPT
jgi:predicted kinase